MCDTRFISEDENSNVYFLLTMPKQKERDWLCYTILYTTFETPTIDFLKYFFGKQGLNHYKYVFDIEAKMLSIYRNILRCCCSS